MRIDRPTPRDKYRALHGADAAPAAPPTDGMTHVGGGVFELPNGERVKGREAAEARMGELATRAEDPAPTE